MTKEENTPMTPRPHFLLFNPDQFRSDALAHLGNPQSRTPNFDALARTEGVSFRHAYCQNPVCTPSRCSFMTGWYPHVRGHRTMYHMLRPDEPMMLQILKENGYFVYWGGKNDLTPAQLGYEAYCDVHANVKPKAKNPHGWNAWRGPKNGADWYSFLTGKLEPPLGETEYDDGDWGQVHAAVDFIGAYRGEKPLCVYLPLGYPHPPYGVEEPYYSMIARDGSWPRTPTPREWGGKPALLKGIFDRQHLTHFAEARWEELRAVYLGMCARVDAQFALVRRALIERGFWDDTAAFVFSDHGDFTGDYGLVEKTQNTFEDCLTRTPFLFKGPKALPVKPGIRDCLVENIDLSETVYELSGIQPRCTRFGKSLLPHLGNASLEHRDAVFCEGGRLPGEEHAKEMESTKTMADPSESLYWPRVGLQQSDGPEHGKAVMCRTKTRKYVRRLLEKDELYDLERDPAETRNLIDDPAYVEDARELRDRTLTFFMETGDVVPWEADKRH